MYDTKMINVRDSHKIIKPNIIKDKNPCPYISKFLSWNIIGCALVIDKSFFWLNNICLNDSYNRLQRMQYFILWMPNFCQTLSIVFYFAIIILIFKYSVIRVDAMFLHKNFYALCNFLIYFLYKSTYFWQMEQLYKVI